MNFRKIPGKKPLKLLLISLSWLIVVTASAAIYYSLSMENTVTTAQAVIRFDSGPDEPSGSTVNPSWCNLALKAYPNATLTYEKALWVNNTDSVNPHSLRLDHVSVTPANGTADNGNFTYIYFKFYVASNDTLAFSFNYTVDGSNNWVGDYSAPRSFKSLPQSDQLYVRVETRADENAQADIVANITIAVDVQE